MPAAAATWVLTTAWGSSLSVAAAAIVADAVYVFTYAASTYLINRAARALGPKPPKGLGRSMEINYNATDAGAPIVVGAARVGALECIPPITIGANGRFLHRVHAIAAHECSSFEGTYFDDQFVDNSEFGAITGTLNDGIAGSGAGKYAGYVWMRVYLGTNSQNVDYILNQVDATAFPSTFRGRGITYAAIQYRWDQDVYSSIPVQTYLMHGVIAYDPRLDSSPGNDPTNASYKAWTQNPALLLTWYLTDPILGGGYMADEIDWTTVVTAANTCDALVDIPTATTAPRYTCNGLLLANNDFTENVKIFTDAMLGRVIFRDGKWRIHAGQWQTPTFDISKSDWISPLSISFDGGRDKRFARARCWYVDAGRNWQRVECAPRFNSTYYAADGNEWNDTEFEQPLCNDEYEAQRKTEMLLRQSRNQVIITGRLPPRFQDIALWDTGAISDPDLGWSDKTFRCVGIDLNPDGSMNCVFHEEQESDWDDLEEADYNAESDAALPSISPTTPSEPSSFTVAPVQINGTLQFTIGEPVVKPIGTRYRIIRSSVSTNAAVGTVVFDGDSLRATLSAPSSTHYYFSQAYVGSYFSAYYPNTLGLAESPARMTVRQTLVDSLSVHNGEVVNPCTYTPDFNGSMAVTALIEGYATLDKDSGTYFSLVNIPTAYTSSPLGYVITNTTGVYAGTGWFTPNSTTQFVTINGVFDMSSGTSYTFGVLGTRAFGTLTFRRVEMSHQFTRY